MSEEENEMWYCPDLPNTKFVRKSVEPSYILVGQEEYLGYLIIKEEAEELRQQNEKLRKELEVLKLKLSPQPDLK